MGTYGLMTEAATAAACWLASTAAAVKPTNATINAPIIGPKSIGPLMNENLSK